MFNNAQVEKIPKDLELLYRWEHPDGEGASRIIVEETIEFIPFSNWLTILATNEKIQGGKLIFEQQCQILANKKI